MRTGDLFKTGSELNVVAMAKIMVLNDRYHTDSIDEII